MSDEENPDCPTEECIVLQFNEAFPETSEEVDDDVGYCVTHERKVEDYTVEDFEEDTERHELDISDWFHDEDGAGVILDTLAESRAQAKEARELFSEINIKLDGLLDKPETLESDEVEELRSIQQQFQHYRKVMDVRAEQLSEEYEEAREKFDRD